MTFVSSMSPSKYKLWNFRSVGILCCGQHKRNKLSIAGLSYESLIKTAIKGNMRVF